MTIDEALDIVVGRTRVERYRYLCLDQPDLAERIVWSNWIIQEAQRDELPNIDAHLAEAVMRPQYEVKPCGGCPG